jgi:dTDP-4-amino-4,6-dideoxygalactose transaminase
VEEHPIAGPPTPTVPRIPLFDLRMEQADLDAVAEALRAGELIAGERVAAFEREFADRLGVKHGVALASCTAALHLAYLAAGVGPGDEVVVPTYTFVATAAAAIYCGATPVFADVVGEHDLGVDVEQVAELIGPRTKAVAVVHYGGYAAAVEELAALCEERGVALVEDAAHAPLAQAREGRPLGTFGTGCFSFFSNKVLSAGEGGLIATDDDEVAATARRLREPTEGFDHRLDEPRAALLRSRIARMPEDVEARRRLTLAYRERLADIEGVTVPYGDEEVARSSCYVMPVFVDPERRDAIREALSAAAVQTSVLYAAIHEFTAYRERFGVPSLPRAERAGRANICLPLFGHLSEGELDRVVETLAEAVR